MSGVLSLRRNRLLVFGLLVTACTGSSVPTTTAITATSISPTTSEAPDSFPTEWTRIPDDEVTSGEGREVTESVTAGGPGLVAVGWVESDSDEDAAVSTSTDGVTWFRVADDALGEQGGQRMLGVTTGGPGLVAVGLDDSGGDEDAAVWASTDGIGWTRIPHHDPLGGEDSQVMTSVTTAGSGLVAVGWDDWGGDRDAAIWTTISQSVGPEIWLGVPIGPSRLPGALCMTPFTSSKLSLKPEDALHRSTCTTAVFSPEYGAGHSASLSCLDIVSE